MFVDGLPMDMWRTMPNNCMGRCVSKIVHTKKVCFYLAFGL